MSPSNIALLLFSLAAAAPVYGVANAQSGSAAAGQDIAHTWCNNCHLVGPKETGATRDGAPSFAAIARLPSTTRLSLHAFLQTSHGEMPDLALTRRQVDDATAYILSLQSPAP